VKHLADLSTRHKQLTWE